VAEHEQALVRVEIGGPHAPVSVKRVVDVGQGDIYALVTSPAPIEKTRPVFRPLVNATVGDAMNQNAAVGGTPINVHNGTDSVLWTGTNVVGSKVTFNSTDYAKNGTKSIKVDAPAVNNVWQLDKGSSQSLTGYYGLSFEVYVTANWASGDSVEVYGWDGSAEVGTRVKLEDYFTESTYNVWHNTVIPFADMGLVGETVTAFRFELVSKVSAAPTFYLDIVRIEETGGALLFKVSSEDTRRLSVNELTLTLVDVLAGSTPHNLLYTSILAVAKPPSALRVVIVLDGETVYDETVLSLADFCGLGFEMYNVFDNGTSTSISLRWVLPEPLVLEGNPDTNYIGILVEGNLSGLDRFTGGVQGKRVLAFNT
jgi:hypothetical protein